MALDASGNLDLLIPRQVRMAEHDDDAVSVDLDEGGRREFEIHVVVALHRRHRCVTGECFEHVERDDVAGMNDAVSRVETVPEDVDERARTPRAEVGVVEYEDGAHREELMESTWRGIVVGSK